MLNSCLGFVLSLILVTTLPETVTIHWNLDGKPNGFGDKGTLMVIGLVPALLWFSMSKLFGFLDMTSFARGFSMHIVAVFSLVPVLTLVHIGYGNIMAVPATLIWAPVLLILVISGIQIGWAMFAGGDNPGDGLLNEIQSSPIGKIVFTAPYLLSGSAILLAMYYVVLILTR